MSSKNSKAYKYCVVPQCDNTTMKTPNMLFVLVPHNSKMRKKWLQLARCDPKTVLPRSTIYFCEDHFDLPNDMENYMQYHVMGAVTQVRMKSGCVPSKFHCQSDREETSDSSESCLHSEIKSEPMEEQYETSEQDNDIDLEDTSVIKIKVEEEPVASTHEFECHTSDLYVTPNQNNDIDIEDDSIVKIEVVEHPVASKREDVSVFLPCTRQILPKINMFSIIEYFVKNDTYKEIDYKSLKTKIDINAEDTIGYVQLHKMDEQLTLQATVAFDRDTAYCCLIKYDEYTRTIDYTNCECQQLACHHVLAFLMWLHRRSEEQLDNDMSFCLEPLVQQTTFLMAKDMVYDSDTGSLSEGVDLPENIEQFQQIQQNIVHEFVKTCKEFNMDNSPLYRYLNTNEQLELSIHRLHTSWRDTRAAGEAGGADHFMQYCTERMAGREATLRELVTCEDTNLRRELQYARLDGRHVFDVGSSMNSEEEGLVDTLLNPDICADNKYIEKMKLTLEKQLNIKINRCGIILCKEYPIYCAVPYGLSDSHVIDSVYLENEEEISNYIEDNVLKLNLQFKLQFNMLLSKREKSYFFIGYKKGGIKNRILIHESKFNRNYCNRFLEKGIRFWKDNVFKIISPT